MSYQHQSLASGRWYKFSLMEQMANIGSEVERTIRWRQKNNLEYSAKAFDRALELLELTISDRRHQHRLRELTRLRETLLDYFVGDNRFNASDENWKKYFYAFSYAASLEKGR